MAQRLAPVLRRVRRHALLALAFTAIGYLYLERYRDYDPTPSGDGLYSWLYARSMAFDRDLHLANDYAVCGDPFHLNVDYGAGRPSNPFYFGSAIVWAPLLMLARKLVTVAPTESAKVLAGCTGPYVRAVGHVGVVLSLLTLACAYRVARRWASRRSCLVAVLAMGFGSPLIAYGTTGWFASHVGSAFAVSLALLAWVRAAERPSSALRVVLAGAALGFAALTRPNEILWGIGPFVFVVARIVREARARRSPRAALVFGALYGVGVASVLWIQLYVWKTLYGSYLVSPTGRLYLQPLHAHPFLLLFSSRSGLLVVTPLMWLGMLGLVLFAWRPPRDAWLGRVLLLGAAAAIWVGASPLAWSGGYTFSARLLTNLTAPFAIACALFLDRAWAWLAARPRLRWVAAAVAFVPALSAAWGMGKPGKISNTHVVRAPKLYAPGLEAALDGVYEAIGNPANLPATAIFAARYRLHPRHFDTLATDGIFQHDYRTTALVNADTIDLRRPLPEVVVPPEHADPRGLVARPGGASRFLVVLGWPWVTHVVAQVESEVAATLTLRVRGFFLSRSFEVPVPAGGGRVEVAVPRGAFDSGIVEIAAEATAEVVVAALTLVDRTKHDTRVR